MTRKQGIFQASNVATRDLATDIPIAQGKLRACIQEILRFESTFQIITNADITLEVSDLFEEVYILMEQIQVKNNYKFCYMSIIFIYLNLDQRVCYWSNQRSGSWRSYRHAAS